MGGWAWPGARGRGGGGTPFLSSGLRGISKYSRGRGGYGWAGRAGRGAGRGAGRRGFASGGKTKIFKSKTLRSQKCSAAAGG